MFTSVLAPFVRSQDRLMAWVANERAIATVRICAIVSARDAWSPRIRVSSSSSLGAVESSLNLCIVEAEPLMLQLAFLAS